MAEINPVYDEETLNEAKISFKLSGNLQLLSFLSSKGLEHFKHSRFKRVFIPEEYSHSVAKAPAIKGLQSILQKLTGKKFTFSVLKFEHGDYTVLYDALKPAKGVAVILDLADFDESWGGYTSFMKDSEELFRVVAKQNSLTLVNQSGLKSFTKYVNHHAQHPRIFLYGVQQK